MAEKGAIHTDHFFCETDADAVKDASATSSACLHRKVMEKCSEMQKCVM